MSNDATLVLRKRDTYIDQNLRPWKNLSMLLCPQMVLYMKLAAAGKIHGSVLEVGFGTGSQVAQYYHGANWVTAMEVDPKAVRFAKDHWPLPRIDWIEADICAFKADGLYDTILCLEVLEHVTKPQQAMQNMSKALRGGGTAFISVPAGADLNELHRHSWDPDRFKAELSGYFGHVNIRFTKPLLFAECDNNA